MSFISSSRSLSSSSNKSSTVNNTSSHSKGLLSYFTSIFTTRSNSSASGNSANISKKSKYYSSEPYTNTRSAIITNHHTNNYSDEEEEDNEEIQSNSATTPSSLDSNDDDDNHYKDPRRNHNNYYLQPFTANSSNISSFNSFPSNSSYNAKRKGAQFLLLPGKKNKTHNSAHPDNKSMLESETEESSEHIDSEVSNYTASGEEGHKTHYKYNRNRKNNVEHTNLSQKHHFPCLSTKQPTLKLAAKHSKASSINNNNARKPQLDKLYPVADPSAEILAINPSVWRGVEYRDNHNSVQCLYSVDYSDENYVTLKHWKEAQGEVKREEKPSNKRKTRNKATFNKKQMFLSDEGQLVEYNGFSRDKLNTCLASLLHSILSKSSSGSFLIFHFKSSHNNHTNLGKYNDSQAYFNVIRHPITLTIIQHRIENNYYCSVREFIGDIHLAIENALQFYPSTHNNYKAAQELWSDFMKLMLSKRKSLPAECQIDFDLLFKQFNSRSIVRTDFFIIPRLEQHCIHSARNLPSALTRRLARRAMKIPNHWPKKLWFNNARLDKPLEE
jgi:hypothetical protein